MSSQVQLRDNQVKPLFKHPGNKFNELNKLLPLVYNITDSEKLQWIAEPFAGSAAFSLQFTKRRNINKIFLNDKDELVMGLHLAIKTANTTVERFLTNFARSWYHLSNFHKTMLDTIVEYLEECIDNPERASSLLPAVLDVIYNNVHFMATTNTFPVINEMGFLVTSDKQLKTVLEKMVHETMVSYMQKHEGEGYSPYYIALKLISRLKGELYYRVRTIFNDLKHVNEITYRNPRDELVTLTTEGALKVATYYLLKSLGYGGLSRYNKKGEFNIPYGGLSYNDKNLKKIVSELFSFETRILYRKFVLYSMDFEPFLTTLADSSLAYYGLKKQNGIIFIDPPYHTPFQEYNQGLTFTENDHLRLSKLLAKLADEGFNLLLVLEDTEEARKHYINFLDHPRVLTSYYRTKFKVNIKRRNSRESVRLVAYTSD